MAIKIEYRGKIKDIKLVNSLIDEVDEIGKILGWKVKMAQEYSSRKKYKLYIDLFGISLTPPKSESVYFTFLQDGTLMTPTTILLDQVEEVLEEEYQASTKTQFAGPDIHVAVVKLIKYVAKKYLENFEVKDATEYWTSEEPEAVESAFEKVILNTEMVEAAVRKIRLPKEVFIQSFSDAMDMVLNPKWEDLK